MFNFSSGKALIKASFQFQLKYCSLIWIFYSRTSNNNITVLHERALRMIYSDQTSSTRTLEEGISFTVDYFNIPSLAIEVFQVSSNTDRTFINDFLKFTICLLRYIIIWGIFLDLAMQFV